MHPTLRAYTPRARCPRCNFSLGIQIQAWTCTSWATHQMAGQTMELRFDCCSGTAQNTCQPAPRYTSKLLNALKQCRWYHRLHTENVPLDTKLEGNLTCRWQSLTPLQWPSHHASMAGAHLLLFNYAIANHFKKAPWSHLDFPIPRKAQKIGNL